MNEKKLTALVCPLDWGLGHASRMIPVIRELIRTGYHVLLGGSGKSSALLKDEFPFLEQIPLPSLRIRYSRNSTQIFKLFAQLPYMISSAIKEHIFLKQLLTEHRIDIVISDNRYGLFHHHIYSILVTHQIAIVLPRIIRILEYPLYRMTRMLINRFDECWIPDYPDSQINLSGKLSHRFRLPANARFIGPLSRFKGKKPAIQYLNAPWYKLVIVLSGPEPQRSMLFDLLWEQVSSLDIKTLIICGFSTTLSSSRPDHDHIQCLPHLNTDVFHATLYNAGVVLCRSGYSGIMDLLAMRKPAMLIPTPGQPEQEYLARYLSEKGLFMVFKQKNFNLQQAMAAFEKRNLQIPANALPSDNERLSLLITDLYKKNKQYADETCQES